MKYSVNKSRILIVDDILGNIKTSVSALMEDYQLSLATNGPDALKIALAKDIDLILLDVVMPGMSGFEVCEKLKANRITQGIPIIFVTNLGEEINETKGIEIGAEDYIVKPISTSVLKARIRGILERKQSADRLKLLNEHLEDLVEERKRMEERHRAVFMDAPDAIIACDNRGLVVDYNPAAETLFGFPQHTILGYSITKLIADPSQRQRCQQALDRSRAKGVNITGLQHKFEVQGQQADGHIIDLHVSLVSLVQRGRPRFTAFIRDITERKQMVDALKKSQRLLAETEKVGKVGGWEFYMDTGKLTWTDEVYNIHEVDLGFDLTVEKAINFYTPASRAIIEEAVQRAMARGEPYDVELEIITAKGRLRHVHTIGKTDLAARKVYGFFQDITEHKKSEAAVKKISELIASAEIIGGLGSWEWDIASGQEIWSDNFFRIMGWQPGEVEPTFQQFLGRVHPEDRQGVLNANQRAMQEPDFDYHIEFRVTLPNGQNKIIQGQGKKKCDESGQMVGMYGIGQDVTQLRQIEEDRLLLEKKSMRSAQLAMVGELSACVAHEINNPNNSISFSTSLLAGAWGDALPILERYAQEHGDFMLGGFPFSSMGERIPQLLSLTRENSQRIKNIINNIKYMSRPSPGSIRQVDVNTVVKNVAEMVVSKARNLTDHFKIILSEENPVVFGNASELEQVLANLVLNAMEALPDRDGSVTVLVQVGEELEKSMVAIQVKDQGVGIPREILDKIFQPFFTTKQENGGTGLGLSISRNIIIAHGGDIRVESRVGHGTLMTILLPTSENNHAQAS